MSVRVYVPLTSSELAVLAEEGRLSGPREAHAVTSGLRAAWPEADEDDWEWAAMLAAGEDSWALRSTPDRPRRIVLAVDVPEVAEQPEAESASAVRVAADLVLKRVASVHVDTEDVSGDPDFEEDLAWFAVQELPHLL